MSISIDPNTSSQDLINVDPSTSSVALPPDIAMSRAKTTHFALNDVLPDKSFEEIHNDIITGKESQLRTQAAAALDVQKSEKVKQTLIDASKQGSLNPSDVQKAVALANQKTDPSSVTEERYARQYMRFLNWSTDEPGYSTPYKDAINEVPDQVHTTVQQGAGLLAKMTFTDSKIQDTQAIIKNQSYLGYGADFAKSFFPFYNELKLREHFKNLLGEDLDQQGIRLFSLPTMDQFKEGFNKIYDPLSKDNPQLAMYWLQSIRGMSSNEKTLANVGTLIDLTQLKPLAVAGLARKAFLNNTATIAARGMITSAEEATAKGAAVTAATGAGDLKGAAIIRAATSLTHVLTGVNNPIEDIAGQMPSILKTTAEKVGKNPGNFGTELTNRLVDWMTNKTVDLFRRLETVARVERIPELKAIPAMTKRLEEDIRENYPGLANQIMNMESPVWNRTTNTREVPVNLGFNDATNYNFHEQAVGMVEYQGLGNGTVRSIYKPDEVADKTSTGPFFIRVNIPVKESILRDFYATTENTKAPMSFLNSLIGWGRTPEETQSFQEMVNRKVVVNGQGVIREFFKVAAKDIKGLFNNKVAYRDFTRVLEDNRKAGKWAEDPLELEGMYQQSVGRVPNANETQAYFAHKYITETANVINNLTAYKNAHRYGAMSYTLTSLASDGTKAVSSAFNGIARGELPRGKGSIYIHGSTPEESGIFERGVGLTGELGKKIDDAVEKGTMKVIEVHDPASYPLKGFGIVKGEDEGHRIKYVVTSNVKTDNLKFNQIPVKAGGYADLEYDHYLVQPRINREGDWRHYDGDRTLMGFTNRAMGQDAAKIWNRVRILLNEGKEAEAEQAAKDGKLPLNWKDIKDKFVGPNAVHSLTEPFTTVPRNRMSINMPGNGIKERNGGDSLFKDGTIGGSAKAQANYASMNGRDTGEVFSMRNKGSRVNPVYQLEPSQYLDPMTTLNRAVNRAVESLFMNDYKIYSVEHWVAQAREYLNERYTGDALKNPYRYFNSEGPSVYKIGTDPAIQRQLDNQRFQIKQFIGIPSKTDQVLHSWSQTLADSIYSKWNPDQYGPITRSTLLTPPWLLANATKPIDFVRSFAFQATMGFWSPVPLFVWSMNYATVLGIAGATKAGPGLAGAILHQMSRFSDNPAVLDHLDKIASRLGAFKAGDLKMFKDAMESTGFDKMVGETSMQSYDLAPKLFQSGLHNTLNFGLFFFKAADRNLHYSAWYTAAKEFRDIHPTGALTNDDIGWILHRADLLATNMSEASKSNLQRGIFAPAAQFTSFTLRLWEQALGHRLSGIEKTRLIGTYAALFGIPGSAGLLSGPYPAGDSLRQAAIEHGYFPGDNQWHTAVMEGGLSMLGHLIGNEYYNVGQRYGFESIFNASIRDKTVWDIAGGASASTLANIWASTHPFWNMIQSQVRGDGKFTPQLQDYLGVVDNINSFHIVNRGVTALSTGRWLTRNESYVGDVTPGQAIFQSVTGLKTQAEADQQTYHISEEDQRNAWKVGEREAIKQQRRGYEAMHNDDPQQATSYFRNAKYSLEAVGYPTHLQVDIYRKASNDWEDTIAKTKWDYYMVEKNVPTSDINQRQETYQKMNQIKSRQ